MNDPTINNEVTNTNTYFRKISNFKILSRNFSPAKISRFSVYYLNSIPCW